MPQAVTPQLLTPMPLVRAIQDYMSLPQGDEAGQRSQAEQITLALALGAILNLYASPRVHVVQQRCAPTPRTHSATLPCAGALHAHLA